ncbi:hypothetical protein ACRAWF_16925 [Streptomyces sp. L7]
MLIGDRAPPRQGCAGRPGHHVTRRLLPPATGETRSPTALVERDFGDREDGELMARAAGSPPRSGVPPPITGTAWTCRRAPAGLRLRRSTSTPCRADVRQQRHGELVRVGARPRDGRSSHAR